MDFDDDDGGGGEAAWMATFADLSTLLLTFFVLLLSFANMDVVQFRMALGSVKEALGVQFEHPGDIAGMATSPVELSKQESTAAVPLFDELQLLERVKAVAKEKDLDDVLEAELGDRGVLIRVKGKLLFESGEATLRTLGEETLQAIADIGAEIPYPILIEGHTDDRPIRTSKFPSNWELSTSRATTALRFLAKTGINSERLGVAGYAHMRPLVDNDTPENRSRNRRVEFVFLTPAEAKDKRETMQEKLKSADALETEEREIGPQDSGESDKSSSAGKADKADQEPTPAIEPPPGTRK